MKAPRGTVVKLTPSAKQLGMQQTIDTMRLLIATMVHRYGVFDMLTLTADEIAAVREGNLMVADTKDGDIILRIKGLPPKLVLAKT